MYSSSDIGSSRFETADTHGGEPVSDRVTRTVKLNDNQLHWLSRGPVKKLCLHLSIVNSNWLYQVGHVYTNSTWFDSCQYVLLTRITEVVHIRSTGPLQFAFTEQKMTPQHAIKMDLTKWKVDQKERQVWSTNLSMRKQKDRISLECLRLACEFKGRDRHRAEEMGYPRALVTLDPQRGNNASKTDRVTWYVHGFCGTQKVRWLSECSTTKDCTTSKRQFSCGFPC